APADTARLVDGRVVVEPLGASVAVPPYWLGGPAPPYFPREMCPGVDRGTVADRVVTGPARLAALRDVLGDLSRRGRAVEWSREFSAAADSALPFTALVAQFGGVPWGAPCGAPHVRVYVGDYTPAALDSTAARGAAAAARFFAPVRREAADSGGWHVARVSWEAWYHDYGGTARLEFWARPAGGRTLVLVFMLGYWFPEAERGDRAAILASVRMAPPGAARAAAPGGV
ncbi:MAG TPA: hypothetical protein VGD56_12830, partial [Gemmatirosa sp.]